MGLIQMFCIDLKVMCIKRSRRPEPCVKRGDRPRCQAVPEILIFKGAGRRTMSRDRGKFQAGKTAMAAHYSLLYIASEKTGCRHRSFTCLEFSPIPRHIVSCPATSKINIWEPIDVWIRPFHTGFRTPRSFDTHNFQIDTKHFN